MRLPKRREPPALETPEAPDRDRTTTAEGSPNGSAASIADNVLDFEFVDGVNGADPFADESFESARPAPESRPPEPTHLADYERAEDMLHPEPEPSDANRAIVQPAPSSLGRTMPHSLEAEEYLLSCCLLDGADVISRARDAGISPRSFFDSKHGVVFDVLCRLLDAGQPTEMANVAEELKTSRQLDQVGGYAFLAQVSSRIPTTAQAGYFIDKVREQALLREIIRTATSAVEDCYGFSGGIDEFVDGIRERIATVQVGHGTSAILQLAGKRAGVGRVINAAQVRFALKGTPVCTAGNIAMVTALQKVGKSAVIGAMLGAVIGGPDCSGDCLGFSSANPAGLAVLHLDTEQAPADHELLFATALRRANRSEAPAWLYSFGVKGIAVDQLRRLLTRLLRETRKIHAGIHSLFLDGVADFTVDPNDPKDVNPFVTQLEAIGSEFECTVVGVLHLNPAPQNQSTKSRGHLGSQLERKCEVDIRLTKDGDGVSTVFTACARHSPIFEQHGQRFRFDKDAMMHVSLDGTAQQAKDERKAEHLREIAEEVFGEASSLRASALVSGIKSVCKLRSDSGAEDKKGQMARLGVIQKCAGLWTLTK